MTQDLPPWELAWREGRWAETSPPLPDVVEFTKEIGKVGAKTVLDLGCGAGRHTLYLSEMSFHVISLDISDTALLQLRRRLEKEPRKNVTIIKHDMSSLPFIDEYFDAFVSTNVIHHARLSEIRQITREIDRVLKKGSLGLIIVASDQDHKMGQGKLLEPGTYIPTEGDEKGITHHFFSKQEIETLLTAFEILSLREELIPSSTGTHAHFHVTLRKPV